MSISVGNLRDMLNEYSEENEDVNLYELEITVEAFDFRAIMTSAIMDITGLELSDLESGDD